MIFQIRKEVENVENQNKPIKRKEAKEEEQKNQVAGQNKKRKEKKKREKEEEEAEQAEEKTEAKDEEEKEEEQNKPKKKKRTEQITGVGAPFAPSNISDPKFDLLRSQNFDSLLQASIGKFIELPRISSLFSGYPKDMNPKKDSSFRILLTQQRFDLLKEFKDRQGRNQGYVFSGPHGIGKSIEGYIFASYGYINKLPTLYLV